jgi:hypothetical protein
MGLPSRIANQKYGTRTSGIGQSAINGDRRDRDRTCDPLDVNEVTRPLRRRGSEETLETSTVFSITCKPPIKCPLIGPKLGPPIPNNIGGCRNPT